MKSYISLTPNQLNSAENSGWLDIDMNARITNQNGYFDVNIPLSMILGFAEDYRKIIDNAKHELILTRSRTDLNAIIQPADRDAEEFRILLQKVEWMVPYLLPADRHKIQLLRYIQKDPLIAISFRSWA